MRPIAHSAAILLLATAAAPAAASLPADAETSYGYLRTVEGPGRVVQAASGARVDADANYPVLAGDLLEIDPGGRLELSLPDFNVVRLAGGTELLLDRLALSAESDDDETALRLLRGEIQLLVKDLLPVAERPRVDTANATIYLQGSGVYRIATDGYGWTEVVVRSGFAEIATEAGASVVRSGEQAWVEGGRWPRIGVDRAGGPDDLERWGAELDDELAAWGEPVDEYVEDHLTYAAVPLARHGSWVSYEGYRAWRPAVGPGWRPYEAGYWADTPGGMVWVSSEPWAWVTYHYGSWVPTPSYGWVWRPGYRFSPAWVYWYWGPSYVAWVPVGYYSHHYGHYGRGFRLGVYGWAGGSWNYFSDWTFCSTRDFRRRDLRRHVHRGHQLARDTRSRPLERGLISTDSRRDARQRAVRGAPDGESLPDVTAFVARRRDLPAEVSERVFGDRRAVSRRDAGEVWERPAEARRGAPGARPNALRSRTAVPREDGRQSLETWRRESGRLRAVDSPGAGPPAPPGRTVSPGNRAAERSRWWEERAGRAAPRAAPPAAEGSRGAGPRSAVPSPSAQGRQPVVRRVWEGIRDRQRTRPSDARPSGAAPAPRPPAAARRPEPPRRSSAEGRSAPSRRPPAARSNSSSGSSRGSSSARSPNRSSSQRSSEGSSRGRTARRKPPS